MRPIVVLGANGMLGQMVSSYFGNKGFTIHKISYRFDNEQRNNFIKEVQKYPDAIVINCIGKIRQKTQDDDLLLWANSLLPLALKTHLPHTQTIVHPSTDCVFSGNTQQPYKHNDTPDAIDTYGWSKYLGEKALLDRKNTIIYRVSIIGPDNSKTGKGLLSWFLNNPPKATLNGYTNHYWNGITTLEWCKRIEQLLKTENLKNSTVFETGGTLEHYSKYEMLKIFQDCYSTNFKILPFETVDGVDRRIIPTIVSYDLNQQLQDLKEYSI